EEMGVPVIKSLNESQFENINNWLISDDRVEVNYRDQTRSIVRRIFEMDVHRILHKNRWLSGYKMTLEGSRPPRVAF
ncbi:MAG: hypothetical protein WCK34_18855, partial [Bacteroidota bacterium]